MERGLRLVPLRPEDTELARTWAPIRAGAMRLAPRPDELAWVGFVREMLPVAEADPTRLPVVMVAAPRPGEVGDGEPVGYLTLDWGPRSRRYAPPGALGIHGFLVDHRQRRRGYALAALLSLPWLVRATLPGWTALALSVNVQNAPAIATYEAGGFVDTGELFLGGDAGPQHVMTRPL